MGEHSANKTAAGSYLPPSNSEVPASCSAAMSAVVVTISPVVATMSAVIVIAGALFGISGVMLLTCSVVAGLCRATRIRPSMGVFIPRLAVVTMSRRVVGAVVGGLGVEGVFIRILTVVVRMVAIIFSMSVLSRGRCCES